MGHDRNLAISLREPRRAHQHLTIPFPALYSQQPLPAVIPHHIATFSRLSRYTGLLPARPGPARLPPPQHHTPIGKRPGPAALQLFREHSRTAQRLHYRSNPHSANNLPQRVVRPDSCRPALCGHAFTYTAWQKLRHPSHHFPCPAGPPRPALHPPLTRRGPQQPQRHGRTVPAQDALPRMRPARAQRREGRLEAGGAVLSRRARPRLGFPAVL